MTRIGHESYNSVAQEHIAIPHISCLWLSTLVIL